MKDAIDSTPAERSLSGHEFANRKLIRPSLNRSDNHHASPNHNGQSSDRPPQRDRGERNDRPHGHERVERSNSGKKLPPPEQTNAENFYYQKQMQSKTLMVVVLHGGEQIHGVIEWYDKTCLKLNRNTGPNLLIYKPSIKYMYKEGEK